MEVKKADYLSWASVAVLTALIIGALTGGALAIFCQNLVLGSLGGFLVALCLAYAFIKELHSRVRWDEKE